MGSLAREETHLEVAVLPVGLILLVVVAGLIYFGLAHRILDRMRLTDKQALIFIALLFLGSFVTIPWRGFGLDLRINLGGFVLPVALAIYVLARADEAKEWVRALVATALTSGILIFLTRTFTFGPHGGNPAIIDPLYLFPLVAGVVAYILGRSRRGAFIAGVLSIVILDIYTLLRGDAGGGAGALGGAGFFDAIVISGLLAVVLAEGVGELRERAAGGHKEKKEADGSALATGLGHEDGEKEGESDA